MTSHDFPSKRCHIYLVFNETGCKGTTKNAYTQGKLQKIHFFMTF